MLRLPCCIGVLTPVFEQEQPQGAAELLKRQEELEKKAAELDRREREMQTLSASGGEPGLAEGARVATSGFTPARAPLFQAGKTTGRPCRRVSQWAPVSTRTSRWTSRLSSRRRSRSCITCGCVSGCFCPHRERETSSGSSGIRNLVACEVN